MAATCPYCGNTNTWVMNGTALKCRKCHRTSTLPSHAQSTRSSRERGEVCDDVCDMVGSVFGSADDSNSSDSSSGGD